MAFLLIFFGVIFIDQAVKFIVVASLQVGDVVKAIPGIISITSEQNYGVAFSLLENILDGKILALVSGIIVLVIIILMVTKVIGGRGERIAMTFVIAGAVSNALDRLVSGYVVDMFKFEFITFGIFNVADICIVIGIIIFAILWIRNDGSSKKKVKGKAKDVDSESEQDYDSEGYAYGSYNPESFEIDQSVFEEENWKKGQAGKKKSNKKKQTRDIDYQEPDFHEPEEQGYSLNQILEEFYKDNDNK